MGQFVAGFFSIYFVIVAIALYLWLFMPVHPAKTIMFTTGTICGGCVLLAGVALVLAFGTGD